MATQTSTDEGLIEAGGAGYVVDRVVICDAFREPDRHYQLRPGGKSKLTDGRRPSLRYRVSAKQAKGGAAGVTGKEAGLFEDLAHHPGEVRMHEVSTGDVDAHGQEIVVRVALLPGLHLAAGLA